MLKKIIPIAALLLSALCLFAACSKKTTAQANALSIGVTAGPHAQILEFVRDQAKAQGLTVHIVEFNDFILPNIALNEGDLDANCYQHQPFLDDQIRTRGYNLISLGKTILLPMAIYSDKYKTLEELPEKAQVGIPNDPTNGSRALLLLQEKGLIHLKDNAGNTPSLLDIAGSPKQLNIIEIEAPQLPRSLPDLDAAIINTDWALVAGLDIKETTITQESTDSPYANIFVVRNFDKDKAIFEDFLNIYQSTATETYIQKTFGSAVIPAWK
tara:strand:+ start:21192 stop:22001 length:810 start_codon:yes stop_codon:yes gene_type:complete